MSEYQETLISFGIPTYNRADKIHISIDSILNQGYDNLEIIISDNHSTDNTEAVCQEYVKKDPRIKYYKQEQNLGPIPNWSYVMKQAKGKYYMHLADDDWMEPGVLGKYVDFMEKNPDYMACSGQFTNWSDGKIAFVEKDFNLEQEKPADRILACNRLMIHCGMYYSFMRREYIIKVNPRMMIQHDWLIVAGVAYFGKLKNFDFIGYNKDLGGMSSEWTQGYAKYVNASKFAAHFSYFVTGFKMFTEILYKNKIYRTIPFYKRFTVGLKSWLNITKRYYVDPIKKSGKPGFEVHIIKPLKGFLRGYLFYKLLLNINKFRKKIKF